MRMKERRLFEKAEAFGVQKICQRRGLGLLRGVGWLLVKTKKTDHLYHKVAQETLRLRCVRSICCGALHKKFFYQQGAEIMVPFTITGGPVHPQGNRCIGK